MANGNGNGENWPAFAGKTIVNSGLVGVVLWWGATRVIEPAQQEQREFVRAVRIATEKQAENGAKTAEALREMSQNQIQIIKVQEQIRDDQRRGVWNQAKAQ